MTEACSCLGKNCCFTESWFCFFLGGKFIIYSNAGINNKTNKSSAEEFYLNYSF